jgi:hypothetical protein
VSTSAPYQSVPLQTGAVPSVVTAPGSLAWGPFVSGVIGAITFGILPAFLWAGKFFSFAEQEFSRFSAAADAALAIDDTPQSRRSLQKALDGVRPSRFLAMLPKLFAAFATSLLFMEFVNRRFTLDRLVQYTYGVRELIPYPWQGPFWVGRFPHTAMVYQLWVFSLLAAYILQFVHVRLYRNGVRRFVSEFNRIAEKRGLLPVRMRTGAPFGATTVLGSVLFGMSGAWWGIPMLLAASAQSRYTMMSSRRALAVQFADRTSRVAVRRSVERRCAAPGCRALLPLPARFCPQCGTRVPDPMVDMRG